MNSLQNVEASVPSRRYITQIAVIQEDSNKQTGAIIAGPVSGTLTKFQKLYSYIAIRAYNYSSDIRAAI